jgi:indole-3-glycerol phosphate synthase
MMNTLKRIIDDKKTEIPKKLPSGNFKPTVKDVVSLLQPKNRMSLIAEIKRKSPSKGSINPQMTVKKAIELYQPYANAISVLTEKNYFGGSLADLKEASESTSLPLLRKDFLTDPVQIAEARYYGADFYLLIAAALDKNQLAELIHAGAEWNMPALVEVHNEAELETALDLEVQLLGINNRSLVDLTIDLNVTKNLSGRIPPAIRKEIILISESGIKNKEDLDFARFYTDGVLIGTAFMDSPDPEKLLCEMFGQ